MSVPYAQVIILTLLTWGSTRSWSSILQVLLVEAASKHYISFVSTQTCHFNITSMFYLYTASIIQPFYSSTLIEVFTCWGNQRTFFRNCFQSKIVRSKVTTDLRSRTLRGVTQRGHGRDKTEEWKTTFLKSSFNWMWRPNWLWNLEMKLKTMRNMAHTTIVED